MVDKERRSEGALVPLRMLRQLNEAQRITLTSLENFGWQLKFVRHPLFQSPVPVVFDPDHDRFAVIEDDGSLNETADIKVRG